MATIKINHGWRYTDQSPKISVAGLGIQYGICCPDGTVGPGTGVGVKGDKGDKGDRGDPARQLFDSVRYRVGAGPILDGYMERNADGSRQIVDLALSPVLGAIAVPNTLVTPDLYAEVDYRVGIDPTVRSGFRQRAVDGTLIIVDSNLTPVPGAIAVTTTTTPTPELFGAVRYTVGIDPTIRNGYNQRNADGTTVIVDGNLTIVPGAIPVVDLPPSELYAAVRYTVGVDPTIRSGYRQRATDGTLSIVDLNLVVVPGANPVPDANDIIRRIRYRLGGVGPIIDGYEIRKPDGSLSYTNLSFVDQPTAVLEIDRIIVRRHFVFTLTTGAETSFTLPEVPISADLVELSYRGWTMDNGFHFSVTGTTVDFSAAGLTLGSSERLDCYYMVEV